MRNGILLFLMILCSAVCAQLEAPAQAPALSQSRSMSIPLNGLLLFDQVSQVWVWTFGKEPGSRILRSDRDAGVIEGTARYNFRSKMLTGREESMGTVTYHIRLQVRAGECLAVVSSFTHVGNSNATRRAINMGQLLQSEGSWTSARGLSHGNAVKLHVELREGVTAHVQTLLQTMEHRLRSGLE